MPQDENDYLRDVSLRWVLGRLQLAALPVISLLALRSKFPPSPPESVRALLANMLLMAGVCPHIDLQNAHVDPYDASEPVAAARAMFDKRAAAAIFARVSPHLGVRMAPKIQWKQHKPYPVSDTTGETIDTPGRNLYSSRALLEMKFYNRAAPTVYHPTAKSLAAMAYLDFFPGTRGAQLRAMVSSALLSAAPGWCGTFGPAVDTLDVIGGKPLEGNYDMTQQHLLRIAYGYFKELLPAARERLVRELLAGGRVHRVNQQGAFTRGAAPRAWYQAGFGSPLGGGHKMIGETENHILMIHTARYLSNQLLYQRQPKLAYDNRRNGIGGALSCLDLLLYLLRNILLDDFSEYNAKSYQHETRTALLNLFNFAYDHEVRLAARMVLDYVSAHMAVSANDCRRMVPFRRRNDGTNATHTADGRMTIGLVESQRGADPMTDHMAMQTGATRTYEVPSEPQRPLPWTIAADGGDATDEMLSDYRMPLPIHDLFVNDAHRRFFQVLNRRDLDPIAVTGRNATNSETFAGSPSYLITAGGSPAPFAIDPYVLVYLPSGQDQQRGVAMPTSFMPTGQSIGNNPDAPELTKVGYAADAGHLIQLGRFAQYGAVRNYGVAPDFLCGELVALPHWCIDAINSNNRRGKFDFVNKRGPPGRPGFYLAILRDGNFAVIEAFDTWRHDELSFDDFRARVWARNHQLSADGLSEFGELSYTTENGNVVHFEMWHAHDDDDVPSHGALVHSIEWSGNDPWDTLPDAPDYRFLKGTVLNSTGDGLVQIANPFLQQTITLDMRDPRHPRRVSELNETEAAGANQEVWVDFDWSGPDASAGDFFRPFRTLAEGVNAVAAGGVINLVPGASAERGVLNGGKGMRLHAPVGEVRIGSLA